MDVTIELWTLMNTHYASCNGPDHWKGASEDKEFLEDMVNTHKNEHTSNGDHVEII